MPAGPPQHPLRASAWLQHDPTRPPPPAREPPPSRPPAPPPPGATVLLGPDGSGLEAWEAADGGAAPWRVEGGALVTTPGTGDLRTREAFGDVQLHAEWMAADEPEKTGQERSNSGVLFLDGRYEVQVLDTFDNPTYADGAAGAIYGQFPPLANALRPPGEWQQFDVFFRGPRFAEDGALREPARLTVLVNGVLVQNNEELPGRTMWLETLPYEAHPPTGRIVLQEHGSPVRFRNLWVLEAPERPAPPQGYADFGAVPLPSAHADRLVGGYDRGGDLMAIERTSDGLGLAMPWRPGVLRLIPLSPTEFQLENTAGRLRFDLPADGPATGLAFEMGGTTYTATRTAR